MDVHQRHRKRIIILGTIAITAFCAILLINLTIDIKYLIGMDFQTLLSEALGVLYNVGIDVAFLILVIVGVTLQVRRIHTLNNHIIIWSYIKFFETLFYGLNTLSILFTQPSLEYQRYIIWTSMPLMIAATLLLLVIIYVHTFRKKWPAKVVLGIVTTMTLASIVLIIKNAVIYGFSIDMYIYILKMMGFLFMSSIMLVQGQHMVDWQQKYLSRDKDQTVFGHHTYHRNKEESLD